MDPITLLKQQLLAIQSLVNVTLAILEQMEVTAPDLPPLDAEGDDTKHPKVFGQNKEK